MSRLQFSFLFLYVRFSSGTVWEFGKDRSNSIVISNNEGDISTFQKTTRVVFTVPSCYEPVYVRVEVLNDLATPSVSYTKDTNTIVLSYKMRQKSLSHYSVVAKAIQLKNCGQKRYPKKSWNKPESEESDEFDETYYVKRKARKGRKRRKEKLHGYERYPKRERVFIQN